MSYQVYPIDIEEGMYGVEEDHVTYVISREKNNRAKIIGISTPLFNLFNIKTWPCVYRPKIVNVLKRYRQGDQKWYDHREEHDF